jgi:hypothetical protein
MDADKLEELERLLAQATKYFALPVSGDEGCMKIWDAQTRLIADVRGWGYLTGKGDGALGLSDDEALKVQREVMALICAAINALEELVAMGRRVAELEARVQELENAGSEMVDWAEHARIFVGSREKMHPDGQSFYDQARGNLYAVITRAALKGTPT